MFRKSHYEEASELARIINLERKDFNLFGIDYALVPGPSTNYDGSMNGLPAENIPQNGEWAIYIWEDDKKRPLDEKIWRPLFFHELVEVYHRVAGLDVTPAHNATMPWEKKFCEDYLNESELERYLEFKKNYGYDAFQLSPHTQNS